MLRPFLHSNSRLPLATRRAASTTLLAIGLVGLGTGSSFAQNANFSDAVPTYARGVPVNIDSVRTLSAAPLLVSPSKSADAWKTTTDAHGARAKVANFSSFNTRATESIPGIQSVPVFEGAFAATGGPRQNTIFPYTMIGNSPLVGHTTVIPAKITTVAVTLLNADGTVFQTVSFDPFEHLAVESPNFEPFPYASGRTQFVDAEQRATFWNTFKDGWHTLLDPHVVNRVSVTIPFSVSAQKADGTVVQARTYFTGKGSDGSTSIKLLDQLFNVLFQNQVISDINAGTDTTDAFNLQLWPNTFLFSLNEPDPTVPGRCCTLGFHTFFADNAVPQSRFVSAYASWISPGVFKGGFEDVAGLSHEISEAFNDPFVDTAVPNWQFPGEPANSTNCQNNLETGDPVEVLPVVSIPIHIRERGTNFVFHPQNEALLQWFNQGPTSDALDGAFSFPDATKLPHSAVPCPQQ